jgi:phage terminase small subunit
MPAPALQTRAPSPGITPRQRSFADAFIETGNKCEAARCAGYSAKSPKQAAYKLLKDPRVKAYIDERRAQLRTKHDLTVDRLLEEYRRIALFNPKQLFDARGVLIAMKDLPDEVAASIASMEVTERVITADGAPTQVIKLRFHNKTQAMADCARILGMMTGEGSADKDAWLKEFFAKLQAAGRALPVVQEVSDERYAVAQVEPASVPQRKPVTIEHKRVIRQVRGGRHATAVRS